MIGHPTIVIGIPVHNEAHHIQETLICLARQSHEDFSVLISDNASTDATGTICREFVALDERFNYHRQGINIGASGNFNFLYDHSESPYFMWLGAHDFISPDYLCDQLRSIRAQPDVSLVYSCVQFIDDVGRYLDRTEGGDFLRNGRSGILRYLRTVRGPWWDCSAINGVFRRSALVGSRFRATRGTDHVVLARAEFFGRFYRSTTALYYRRKRAEYTWEEYLQSLAGDPATGGYRQPSLEYGELCRDHVKDYWTLPLPFVCKVALFPFMLLNLEHAYRCMSDSARRVFRRKGA